MSEVAIESVSQQRPSASEAATLQEHSESLDGIIDTVSAEHPIAAELGLLKIDGKLIMVGVPPKVNNQLPRTLNPKV